MFNWHCRELPAEEMAHKQGQLAAAKAAWHGSRRSCHPWAAPAHLQRLGHQRA